MKATLTNLELEKLSKDDSISKEEFREIAIKDFMEFTKKLWDAKK